MASFVLKRISYGFCVLLLVPFCLKLSLAQGEEKTFFMSLVKTADSEEEKEIYAVGDKQVLTQAWVVQEGDHIWQLFRERGLLKRRNLPELLSLLKKMNKSLSSLDLIYPGQKLILPLEIAPPEGEPTSEGALSTSAAVPKDLKLKNHTVRRGDYLIKIIRGRDEINPDDLYRYLAVVKELNPSIRDLDRIYPGQIIRLPIYRPEIVEETVVEKSVVVEEPVVETPVVVKAPVETATSPEPVDKRKVERISQKPVAHDLGIIFSEMGNEWVQNGEHFIPLKSGGQINLKASSFPIITLDKGQRVIVDLNNKLPGNMARLIESTWENYRVVHLTEDDDQRSSMNKILEIFNYQKVLKDGEPLELGGDIPLRITGDWIIKVSETRSEQKPGYVIINLLDTDTPNTSRPIKDYLKSLGIKVIELPRGENGDFYETDKVEILEGGEDPSSLIKTVLGLTKQSFSTQENISVYQSQKDDIKLIIQMDFFLNFKGRDAVIDLTGLDPEIISLLEEREFQVISLATEKDPLNLVAKTLEFLGIQFQRGPHYFMASARDDSRNIRLALSGIIFSDPDGKTFLATTLSLPDEIKAFLSQRGYKILLLSSS